MKFEEKTILLRDGKACLLRSPGPADGAVMLEYLRQTAAETPYMLRCPDEVAMTMKDEVAYLENMYLGHLVETADADELMSNPIHPYTQSLLSAVPIPDPETARKKHRIVLEGDVPSPLKMPTGCPFRTRCRYATERCAAECPQLTERGTGHECACWNR